MSMGKFEKTVFALALSSALIHLPGDLSDLAMSIKTDHAHKAFNKASVAVDAHGTPEMLETSGCREAYHLYLTKALYQPNITIFDQNVAALGKNFYERCTPLIK